MLDRNHIERVLKINGVAPSANDNEIRSVLMAARFHDGEVDAALLILRSTDDASRGPAIDSMQKLLRTDRSLNAKEISNLLGIDMQLIDKSPSATRNSKQTISLSQHVVIWLLAIVISIIGIGLSMYLLHFGFFHPASTVTFYEYR